MSQLTPLRSAIRTMHLADEQHCLDRLMTTSPIGDHIRQQIVTRATTLVEDIRQQEDPSLMESFLAEYGLSTDEGVALMCLAEALLRVPDTETMDALIEDKIAPSSWGEHLGQSSSSLVNASTWALMLTGKVLQEDASEGLASTLKSAVKRLGEPLIRSAVKQAMKELGNEFVLGRSIKEAIKRGQDNKKQGFTYSYDMLGEAALTEADAQKFLNAYEQAIRQLSKHCHASDIRDNPGISIKLSALHPRYEVSQRERVMQELVARTRSLALLAKQAGMGFNIDAEEADRLDLSLDVIEALLSDPALAGWDGFGVVVQAYGKRCPKVIEWLYTLAKQLDRRIMVRLVKGAYWDTEIKLAQQQGLADYPVYTQKAATDAAYLTCAKMLLGMTDRIYPQFATHNAHTVAAVLELATDLQAFEFQRLHGMGESLHHTVRKQAGTRCRIYAPVGAHRDLLAYLVRRLLENGANSSFVNQIVDTNIPASTVAADPFAKLSQHSPSLVKPAALYAPQRMNAKGWDLRNTDDLADIDAARAPFANAQWHIKPMLAEQAQQLASSTAIARTNPANPDDCLGSVTETSLPQLESAIAQATPWTQQTASERAIILRDAADLYEANFGELFALLTREAGKTPLDAIAELREAVDFLRYYAAGAEQSSNLSPRGVIACISPWNFPLAIFTGQLSAALAAGNSVLAKPAEQSPMCAALAVKLLHQAGVPRTALQLVIGKGSVIGARLSADSRIHGICFTGSTNTAQIINRSMAKHLAPDAPFIAETGGLNAMIVDSTALPEQAVRDIVNSAFQSAGQRCSALRVLYLQEDTADSLLEMLYGAMDELVIGAPWEFATDIGPVIDQLAHQDIGQYLDEAKQQGRLLKALDTPETGYFIAPSVIKVSSIKDMPREIFGPVLHVATFKANEIDQIIQDINHSGYGLTFGLHSRIDDRVESLSTRLNVGNIYINRNQIGAVVGSQPFGGEGLSGTGPKAGGPHYLQRFYQATAAISSTGEASSTQPAPDHIPMLSFAQLQAVLEQLPDAPRKALSTLDLPGPTGESNRLSEYPKNRILCLGPSKAQATQQAQIVKALGCSTLAISHEAIPPINGVTTLTGRFDPEYLRDLTGIDAVIFWGNPEQQRQLRYALANREGAIIPLISDADIPARCVLERHVCIDTTAAGGNASLLAASS